MRGFVRLGVWALLVVIAANWGCWGGKPPRVEAPAINAGAAASGAMKKYDTNADGKIAGPELDKAASLKSALTALDTNGDKAISEDEIKARIESWQQSKIGRMNLVVVVTRNGRPLAGAKITFVPEEFLGGDVPQATGTTDEGGGATLSTVGAAVEGAEGVAPGFYRVEITKDGEIPAKYNTQTILGQEVALDTPAMQEGGINFDLQY